MFNKGIAFCLTVFVICAGMASYAQDKSSNRIVSERVIAQVDTSSRITASFKVSPDSKRVAYVAGTGNKWFVVV